MKNEITKSMQDLVTAHFAHFAPIVERIVRAGRSEGANFWQHSLGKKARDLVQSGAEDIRFGDDPQDVAARTSAQLASLEVA